MPTRLLLHESSATLREKVGNQWEAVLITPGTGSSGTYSEQMLGAYAAEAFPKGTKHWFKHPKEGEGAGDRDPRDQWGYLAEDARFEPGIGIVGKIEVLPHWKEVVESLGTQASLSVWVYGEADTEGNVTQLYGDVTNSVDMIAYPGRPGSGLTKKMYESARGADPVKPGTASVQEKEGLNMEKIEEIEQKLDTFITKFDSFVTESKAAATAVVTAEADAKATDDAVAEALASYDEKVAAIDAAELLAPQVEALRIAARKGEDVTPLIESAKKVVEAAKASITESVSNGRTVGTGSDDLSVGRWTR